MREFLTVVVLLSGSMACIPRSTDANEVGVRFCKFMCWGEKSEVVGPGRTVFLMPLVNDWYTLDISMQDFYMTRDSKTGDRRRRDDLLFKTREGNNISQDVVLTWKLDFRKAEHIVQFVGQSTNEIKELYVRPIARSVIRDFFSRLDSDEYYEGQRRFEEAKNATEELRARFESYGIVVDQVNPKGYQFEDPNYQAAINAAKEAGQELEKFSLERDSRREHWKKELETQIGRSNQTIAAAKGESRSIILRADANLAERKNEAAAIVSERSAEAQAIQKLNDAMASRGGETAVKMEYAKHFNPESVTVLPCPDSRGGVSVQRLDLNALIAAEAARASQ